MNNKLNLAVAGAVLAFGAASAQAGIIIPAGEWTLDVSGNVNTFYSNTNFSGSFEANTVAATYSQIGTAIVVGTSAGTTPSAGSASGSITYVTKNVGGYTLNARTAGSALTKSANEVSTGLLPSAIGFGGKTRQNDIDVAFQTTFFVGANTSTTGVGSWGNNNASLNSLNIRQAYLTFGDKSWGQFKLGRDLGVFGSDAILSDMTLLGVGTGAGGAGSSTLGRIGSGYLYADWIGQIQYQSPNFNGFQVTAAVREPLASSTNHDLGVEGKATFDFAANDVSGRIWLGGIHQKISTAAVAASTTLQSVGAFTTGTSTVTYLYDAGTSAFTKTAEAVEVGAKASVAGFSVVGYYYDGKNIGLPSMLNSGIPASGLTFNNADSADHDVQGGYVQGMFTVPGAGTKIGASWGRSEIEGTNIASAGGATTYSNESWIVGAYHPLTKHLNLVAEYTDAQFKNIQYYKGYDGHARTGSLGAILFF